MGKRDTWDAEQYERYKAARRQPFDDLLALVRPGTFSDVVDLGCGTGELTADLHRTLQATHTLGIDSSPNMLQKAIERVGAVLRTGPRAGTECSPYPDSSRARDAGEGLEFELGDIAEFAAEEEYDLVFSNAALHWLPDHAALLARWWHALRPGGQLALQLPANAPHPTQVAAREVAVREPYATALAQFNVAQGKSADASIAGVALAPERYAEILWELGAAEQHVRLQVYSHELPDESGAFEWIRGSLLTGYEAALGAELYAQFEAAYRERLFELIPPQSPYLLTYRRILMWGGKGSMLKAKC